MDASRWPVRRLPEGALSEKRKYRTFTRGHSARASGSRNRSPARERRVHERASPLEIRSQSPARHGSIGSRVLPRAGRRGKGASRGGSDAVELTAPAGEATAADAWVEDETLVAARRPRCEHLDPADRVAPHHASRVCSSWAS